jgi:hypothetical protein
MLFKPSWSYWSGMFVLFWIVLGVMQYCGGKPFAPALADELIQNHASRSVVIQDRSGRTVLTVKPSPYNGKQRVVRDRRGRTVYTIKPSGYGNGEVIQDRKGNRVDLWLWDEGDD